MTLQALPGGSQRFQSDGGIHTGDVRALTNPPAVVQYTEPLAGADYIRPVPIKGHPNLYYGKATLYDARGPVKQRAKFAEGHFSRANGSLQGDKPGFLRLPHLTSVQTTPDPTSAAYRMMYARYLESDVVGFDSFVDDELLFRATSTSDPTMVQVAGFPPALSPLRLMCLRRVDWAGLSYLMAGYINAGTAASSLQAITNLTTNPPTYAYVPGATSVHDMLQLPDGSLMVYDNRNIVMVDTSVAPGAAVYTDVRASMDYGGYFGGLQSLGGGQPLVYAVTPQNSNLMLFDPAAPGSAKGKLQAISLDGWVVQDVNMGLPWVTFATKVRDGIMACDQHTHVFNNGRRLQTMNWLEDRAPSSESVVVCRGHYTDGQRFWWHPNFLTPSGITYAWWEEYDFDLNVSLPVSAETAYGTPGAQSVGGWDLPYFPDSRYITDYADGNWHRQKQPPLGVLGFNQTKTAGVGTGDDFEETDQNTWPVLQYPGMEGCPSITLSIEAPTNGNIGHGHAAVGAGTTDAYVEWNELLSGVGARFHQRGPDERRPKKLFPSNRSWSYGFQPQCTMGRQTGGTDPSKYTPNGFPSTWEFIFYRDGGSNIVPSQYRNMDATALLRRI